MSHHPRRILPPGESRKRKEREAFYGAAPGGTVAKTTTTTTATTTPRPLLAPPRPAPAPARAAGKAKPAAKKGGGGDNRLLAGYMAHEFLTKGTLLGQRFDPARLEEAAAAAAPGKPAEPKRAKQAGAEPSGGAAEEERASYADVAGILKSDGAHVPGIVNPTQLARWIHQT